MSEEEAAQVGRLRYLLAHGPKEHLVERAADWPGVHSVRAILEDEPLKGYWFSRKDESAARKQRKAFDRLTYATEETVVLSPLPSAGSTSHRSATGSGWRLGLFLAAFRDAADELKAENRQARFPLGSFPPGLPFVRALPP